MFLNIMYSIKYTDMFTHLIVASSLTFVFLCFILNILLVIVCIK